jgi:hypothetical protein
MISVITIIKRDFDTCGVLSKELREERGERGVERGER